MASGSPRNNGTSSSIWFVPEKGSARVIIRAWILLKTDEGWSAPQVAEALDVAVGTVFRIKRRLAEEGLEGVLKDRLQAHRHRKLDDRREAHLVALACSEPYDPQRPAVCFDETSTQLLAETRPPMPPRPGLPLRQDYEYRREGTRNLFLACGRWRAGGRWR